MDHYDVLIIGSGPGGEKAAVQSAKLSKRVAVIERKPFIGGAGIHTGTLPSKALRETAVYLAGLKQRAVYGFYCTLGRETTLEELMHRKTEVTRKQMEVVADHFDRNNIEIIYGEASFVDKFCLAIKDNSGKVKEVSADVIVLAPGTRPARPESVPFDAKHIHDSDTILELKKLPATLTIIGGGVIGSEYACIFAALGVKVTLVEKKEKLLDFADDEMVTSLIYWMSHHNTTLRLGETLTSMEIEKEGRVIIKLESGKSVVSEKVLYTMGRVGNTDALNLKAIGIEPQERGLLKVNENFQTKENHIYAVGDVIGFPSLASTSREQGRLAICHAFATNGGACEIPGTMPFGIYTIPEISMVGANERELTKQGIDYVAGTALFSEVARGQISGDNYGMLKLLFHRETLKLLGVHIIGDRASELIHIGQAVMNYGGTIEYFKDTVFNFPTLSDAYKQAALNGFNKL
ncbi:MAG: Si-specific NAD(P)(+) transhydrogenase [Thermodesulfobacteriota bacterium]